ncbi:MAG TPA: SH3 domain-containing protein [Candidatus Binatia bacterium]|nr:SH3 domain-containing protein [Candidatus Binatia bacterium]
MKKFTIIITLLFIAAVMQTAATPDKVQVTVENANIRSQPGLSGKIVLKAGKGDIFEIMDESNGWFRIKLPAEAEMEEGFVHEAVVEVLDSGKTTAAAGRSTQRKAPAKAAARGRGSAKIAAPEKLFSGLAAKFGYRTNLPGRFGDRWLLALTYEKGINPFLAAGLELQPYFRSFSDAGFSDSALGANLFLNAKGGVNIGRFVESLKFLTPYAGFGLGTAFISSSSEFGGGKVGSTDLYFAWHLMFGFEVALKKLGLIFEIQMLKVSVPEIDPDPTQGWMMIGVRF